MIQAAGVRRRLRTAKVGLVGHPYEGMTDLMFDAVGLRQSIGPSALAGGAGGGGGALR